MKKYLSFFRMRFINGFQYRIAALAGIITQFVWGMMEILMFRAFYRANPSAFPMEFSALSSYVWFQQAFLALFMTWFWEKELFESIKTGNIAYELCRPVDIYSMWFVRGIANRASKAILRCIPILLTGFLLPSPYRLVLPDHLSVFVLFLMSMLLGFLVVVAYGMIIYGLTFYTVNPMGIRMVSQSLAEFLSGAVIPLPFLPDKIRAVVELLPFAAMQNVPFRIYSQDISGSDIYQAMLLQVIWLIILVTVGKIIMNKALGSLTVQGG
ncbi:ABC transporter permease [Lachnotalea glycerini]|jgi:ABC-2 type transport system permease protein|uniref:ABC transporter permease n=1 Tax=Lachnotalea glycerini TaxID=1763509 RepID=A0A371JDI8_9FIRM|nr:ABC-2 family transporter protein [Lachnotalea glycerini]RDY30746.1 ABC transporter permease [Lachnotalea glycerini]